MIMPQHVHPQLDDIISRCVNVLWHEYVADPETVCLVGMSLISYGLSLRLREEGTMAAEDLRTDVLGMIEHDLDKVSLIP